MARLEWRIPRAAGVVIGLALLAGLAGFAYVVLGLGEKSGTAYFSEVKNVYPGDEIRILGISVGKVDKITAQGTQVRVDFHYDRQYSLPAGVKAAIVSPTLVATRFIQLDPAYTGGPVLPDHGVIPRGRTVIPVEFDELKSQLAQLSDALGPRGANSGGALNRALNVIDANGRGQGQNFHDLINQLSRAAKTLSDGSGDLFGTVRNLATFSSTLNTMDGQIVDFDHELADVSAVLNDNTDQMHRLLPKLDQAATGADDFLAHHGAQLGATVDRAGSVSRALAQQRMALANVLHVAPNVLTDFNNIWSPRQQVLAGTLVTPPNLATLGGPGDQFCALITQAAAADEKQGQDMCVKYLGPVFQHLAMQSPPVGVAGPGVPGGGHAPSYGDLESGQADTNHSPNGTNSDLPRSSTADHGGGGGLLGLTQRDGNR